MVAGWNQNNGEIRKYYVSEADLWAAFNYVFSDACHKRSTYKFGLIKAILDNLLYAVPSYRGIELSYSALFAKFTENYWNLVNKYHLRQMRGSTTSNDSKLEQILWKSTSNMSLSNLEYNQLAEEDTRRIVQEVSKECRKNVIGALYENFAGMLYGFDKKGDGIWLNPVAYEFMLKYKPTIEQLNYYSWAKFLEQINNGNESVRIIDKLEISTPKRKDLSIYREILRDEFESDNCFYCGKKLERSAHVDHVIPWSFVKTDNLWNFVLACPECNLRKKDFLPGKKELMKVILRNEQLLQSDKPIIKEEFMGYNSDLMWKLWEYAKQSGLRIINY